MNSMTFARVIFAGVLAAACTTSSAQESQKKEGIWSKVKKSAGSLVSVNGQPIGGQGTEAASGNYTRIADTKLKDIFLAGNAINGDWPHVAIVITDYSDRFNARGTNPMSDVYATDCIYFDAYLWRDAKNSEKFEGLGHCASDGMKSFMQAGITSNFAYGNTLLKDTGQIRNTGPHPPLKVFPQTPEAQRIFDGPGRQLMASILIGMGYDIMHVPNIGRVWVVSVDNKPGT